MTPEDLDELEALLQKADAVEQINHADAELQQRLWENAESLLRLARRGLLAEEMGEALRKWKCDNCDGGGQVRNPSVSVYDRDLYEVCSACDGHGLDLDAAAVLARWDALVAEGMTDESRR